MRALAQSVEGARRPPVAKEKEPAKPNTRAMLLAAAASPRPGPLALS